MTKEEQYARGKEAITRLLPLFKKYHLAPLLHWHVRDKKYVIQARPAGKMYPTFHVGSAESFSKMTAQKQEEKLQSITTKL